MPGNPGIGSTSSMTGMSSTTLTTGPFDVRVSTGSTTGLAQEVRQRGLDQPSRGGERGLVGQLLHLEVQRRLADVDVLQVRERRAHLQLAVGDRLVGLLQ